jgi:hypothetical protein
MGEVDAIAGAVSEEDGGDGIRRVRVALRGGVDEGLIQEHLYGHRAGERISLPRRG